MFVAVAVIVLLLFLLLLSGLVALLSPLLPCAAAAAASATTPNSILIYFNNPTYRTSGSGGVGVGRVPPFALYSSLTAPVAAPGQPGPVFPDQRRDAPPVPTELWVPIALWIVLKSIELCLLTACRSRPTYKYIQCTTIQYSTVYYSTIQHSTIQ